MHGVPCFLLCFHLHVYNWIQVRLLWDSDFWDNTYEWYAACLLGFNKLGIAVILLRDSCGIASRMLELLWLLDHCGRVLQRW